MESGWQGRFEVNRVIYDPQQVTIEEMEAWLQKANTYRSTLEKPLPDNGQMKE